MQKIVEILGMPTGTLFVSTAIHSIHLVDRWPMLKYMPDFNQLAQFKQYILSTPSICLIHLDTQTH
jgi:hypothetical protein